MMVGLAILFVLALLPVIGMIFHQRTLRIEKPRKRTYLFEDEDSNRDNPFKTEVSDDNSSQWKYEVE